MNIGEVIELFSFVAFVVAALVLTSVGVALLVLGAALFYLAQCYGSHPLKLPKLSLPKRNKPDGNE